MYEMGIPRYKHVYFNLTLNTFVIFTFSVTCFLITYETAKGVFKCSIEGTAYFPIIRKLCIVQMSNFLRSC